MMNICVQYNVHLYTLYVHYIEKGYTSIGSEMCVFFGYVLCIQVRR